MPFLYQFYNLSAWGGCSFVDYIRKFKDAYSSGHLVLSHLRLAFVLMLRPFFPELVMSTDLFEFRTSLSTSILLIYNFLNVGPFD